jgi:hypothetical protein
MNQHGLDPVTASPPPSGLAVAARAFNRLFYENIPFCLSGAQPDFFCRASSDLTIAFFDIEITGRSARRRASATATRSNGSEHNPVRVQTADRGGLVCFAVNRREILSQSE